MFPLLFFISLALPILLISLAFIPRFRKSRGVAIANIAEGTHVGGYTRLTDSAIGRFLLVKKGTDDNHVAINGANTVPIGVTSNEATAAEQTINVLFLGAAPKSRLMVANGAIGSGVLVYTAAGGKISPLSGVSGTYYCVGSSAQAASADGDLLEVDPCVPQKIVVP